jgi:Rhodopirellula transposase DDE domain
VATATGMAPSTIGRGLKELAQDEPSERVRRPGAGRKPAIAQSLPPRRRGTRACSRISKRWSNRRRAGIGKRHCDGPARACDGWPRLPAQGHQVSRTLVAELLTAAGYSLQDNRKTKEGDSHPDRDAQFAHIITQVAAALAEQQPVISVDTKKEGTCRGFPQSGPRVSSAGRSEEVRVHDFLIKELGRAVPYGVDDLAANSGWASVGVDHDTAAFAVNSIRQWWLTIGRGRYPEATRLLIAATPAPAKAGGGGGNGSRVRLWKREPHTLANELDLDIAVSHPGLRRGRLCRPAPASGTRSSTASSLSSAKTGVPSHSSAIGSSSS